MRVTVTADAEVTKAADIRQWTLRGTFEDDEITVEVGNNAVYVRSTGDPVSDLVCMLRPDSARELARCLNAAADKAELPKDEDH
jgi:hypothetical protein